MSNGEVDIKLGLLRKAFGAYFHNQKCRRVFGLQIFKTFVPSLGIDLGGFF
jgi:hypothetical protein